MLGISIPVSSYCSIMSISNLNERKCRRNIHLVCSGIFLFVANVAWIVHELLISGIPHGRLIGVLSTVASLFSCLVALNRYNDEMKWNRPILLNILVGAILTITHAFITGWIIYNDISNLVQGGPAAALSIMIPTLHLLLGSRSIFFVLSNLVKRKEVVVDRDFMIRNLSSSVLVVIWLIYIIVWGSKAISAEIFETVFILFLSYGLLSENLMIIEEEQIAQNAIELSSPNQNRHFFSITVGDALTTQPDKGEDFASKTSS